MRTEIQDHGRQKADSRIRVSHWLAAAAVMLFSLLLPCARAQVVADSVINTLDNITNNVVGTVTIGTNGSFTGLLLTNSVLLNSSGNGTVGLNAGANSNYVFLQGTNTRWFMGGNLYVGSNGAFNGLVISNGAVVTNRVAVIGFTSSASNNQATVTGPNSVWTNSGFISVGESGSFNSLLITNGGRVENGFGIIGYASGANNNQANVTSPNSVWANSGELWVGGSGSFNSLLINNGGLVSNLGRGFIGIDSAASNNLVTVADPNSVWTNGGFLYVGYSGSSNTLLVTNGGRVANASARIGFTSGASNNQVTVTGTNSVWANSGELRVGSSGSFNSLLINNGGLVANSSGYIGFTSEANSNQVRVTGYNSIWTNSGFLSVGLTGSFNTLLVTNGGRVVDSGGDIGSYSGANSNQVTVTGTNSVWSNSGGLRIGASGSFNTLLVTNGGRVVDSGGDIGGNSGANHNQVTVTGSNSVWSNIGDLNIGYFGSFNTLLVTNGGRVANSFGYIGNNSGANNNQVAVTGPNSVWTNTGDLNVGYFGSSNTLLVSNGGRVANSSGYIGVSSVASNNQVTVTGPNSEWTNSGELRVGSSGSSNMLLISNGGRVANRDGFIDYGNQVTVIGSNSVWANGGELRVGSSGSSNMLLISDGGRVANSDGFIGYGNGANNQATVAGPNSVWSSSGDLNIGYFGSFNTLLVTNGGRVANSFGYIGGNASAGNQVIVTGSNSVWANSGAMQVGSSGSFNSLLIVNGGRVANGSGYVGYGSGYLGYASGANNQATVAGLSSVWSNSGDLSVGYFSSSDTLLITNGGMVENFGYGYIGSNSGANNNQVTVTGSNSIWNNSGEVRVGNGNNTNNQLTVRAGGVVVSSGGRIGSSSTSANFHQVLVADSGSAWSNSGSLYVGETSGGNQLVVSSGALVTASDAFVGFNSSSINNLLRLDNGTLTVTNAGGTAVFDVRRGTNLFNGGTITADRLLLTNGAASVLAFNAGTLNIRSATVSNGAPFIVGNGTSNAALKFTGAGTRTFADGLLIQSNATLAFGAGVLNSPATINRNGQRFTVGDGASTATFNLTGNGSHSFQNTLVIASNAALSGNGTIVGTVTNFGTLAPGNSAGSIRINGDLRLQSSSMLNFEIGGLLTNQYDQLTVTNFVQFAGSLSLALLPGYLPNPQDSFTLLKFGFFSGGFDNAPFLGRVGLANNLASFAVTYTLTNVSVGGVTYADTDGDGQGDLQEQAAGTDPNSSASELKITGVVRTNPGSVTVTFQSVPGKNYRIEYSNDLTTWSVANTNTAAATEGNSTQWTDDGSQTGGLNFLITRRFYRVGLQ